MDKIQKARLMKILKESDIIEALNNNDFQKIYSRLVTEDNNFGSTIKLNVPAFTELLFKANINPLPYLEEIPEYFAANSDIESIKIPEGITRINDFAFYRCRELKNISLPNTLEVIATGAFEKCYSLEKIILPESVQILGDEVFSHCTKLNSIYIGHSLEPDYVGEDIFYNCPLKDIYYNGDITSWGDLKIYKSAIIHCIDGDYKYDGENDYWYEVM